MSRDPNKTVEDSSRLLISHNILLHPSNVSMTEPPLGHLLVKNVVATRNKFK